MFEVLRNHPEFRRLWYAQLASNTGDWLSRIAVVSLIARLGDRESVLGIGALFGIELALRMLPSAVLGPIAGPLADRLPRRALMVVSDLLRAALVLGCLLVQERGDLPLLYVLLGSQMGVSMFFESARAGALPSTVEPDSLHAANALSAATWSAMLTLGAMLGGFLVGPLGIEGLFVLDSATYIVSAYFLLTLHLPPVPIQSEPLRWSAILGLKDLRRGWTHVRNMGQGPAVMAKSFWSPIGGMIVMLSVTAAVRFGDGGSGAEFDTADAGYAMGILFAARGIGTGLGPILAKRLIGSSDMELQWQISLGFVFGSLGYVCFGFMDTLWLAAGAVIFAHMGGSTLWVSSTTLWQKHVQDAFRGRVFACEFFFLTLLFSTFGLASGYLYDHLQSIPTTVWTLSLTILISGVLWTLLARKYQRSGATPAEPAPEPENAKTVEPCADGPDAPPLDSALGLHEPLGDCPEVSAQKNG